MRVQLPNGAPRRNSSKVEPAVDDREALVRFQHPAPFCCRARVTGRDGRCTRLLSETRLVRFQRHPPDSRDWQIWICTRLLSETKWVRFPHPAPTATKRRHSITDQCSELLPRMMRVQISLPPPMWGCGPTDEGARLRTLRSEFNSLHPHQSLARELDGRVLV